MYETFAIMFIIALNSTFVIAEIAILMSDKGRLHKMAKYGKNSGAKVALKLLHEPNKLLSGVQVGITLMGILLGLYGGSSLSIYIADSLKKIPVIGQILIPYLYIVSSIISVTLITYLTVLSEIVPKRIAMMHPEKIATVVAYIMQFFITITYPFIAFLTFSTKLSLSLLGIKETAKHVSLEEVRFVINQAESSGSLRKIERDILNRLVNINTMLVGAIMTPRKQMVALDLNDSDNINAQKIKRYSYSNFPVIKGDINNIIGIIPTKKLLHQQISNALILKQAKITTVHYVPELSKITNLIELFGDKKAKIAIVLDEYGDIEGIVTFNDTLKVFLGDLAAKIEGNMPGIRMQNQNSYIVAGNVLIEEVIELLGIHTLHSDEDYRTLASFVLKQFDGLPKVGQFFVLEGWRFKVSKLDGLRISEVIITNHSNHGTK